MDMIKWLSHFYVKDVSIQNINICNLDNPGWWIMIENSSMQHSKETKLLIYEVNKVDNDSDWIFCDLKDAIFDGHGDALKLNKIIDIYQHLINRNVPIVSKDNHGLTKWLEKWYLGNCDGDWEHCYGVQIQTNEDRMWDIKIDLGWEEYLDMNIVNPYKGIKYEYSEKYGTFKAVCEANLLWESIDLFRKMLLPV